MTDTTVRLTGPIDGTPNVHGTYLGYVNGGCRLECCRAAWRAYRKKLKRRQPRYVDAAPIVTAALELAARWEVAPSAVLKAAGANRHAAPLVLAGRQLRIGRHVADRIRTLTVDDLPDAVLVPLARAFAARDRLLADGWTPADIAAALGLTELRLDKRDRTTLGLVRRLEALADRGRCADCGGEPLAGGRWCLRCFQTHATPVPSPATGHGTDAGYTAHRRAGTPPCQACTAAHTAAKERRKSA